MQSDFGIMSFVDTWCFAEKNDTRHTTECELQKADSNWHYMMNRLKLLVPRLNSWKKMGTEAETREWNKCF